MNNRRRGTNTATLMLLLTCAGACSVPMEPASPAPAQPPAPPPLLLVTAVPMYRLLVEADLPGYSRLYVVRARLEPAGEDRYRFTPGEVRVTLRDGTAGRAFDRDRAQALLRTLQIADAQGPPLPQPSYRPVARVAPDVNAHIREQVAAGLLGDGSFARTDALDGYLVIDTGHPVSSLDGLTLEVTVRRVGDDALVTETYQLGTRPAAGDDDATHATTAATGS